MEKGCVMGDLKLPASCTCCDEPCFEVMARWDEGEERAGQIKRVGPPLLGSVRVVFELYDGSTCDMTFCMKCAETLSPAHYPAIWRKVINSWVYTTGGNIPDWLKKQFDSGILIELSRKPWTFHSAGGEAILG